MIPAQPEQGGPIRPRDIGYRVRILPGPVGYFTVTARPTLRLRVSMIVVPRLHRALVSTMALALRLFPAGVRPTIEVVVTGAESPRRSPG